MTEVAGAMGFFGLSVVTHPKADRAALLSVPAMTPYTGVSVPCADAPEALRRASAVVEPGRWDVDLQHPLFVAPPVDLGVFSLSGNAAADRAQLARRVADIVGAGGRPLIVGGDDSVSIPPLLGLEALDGGTHLVQIDAHLDWKDRLCGEVWGRSSVMRRASEMPWINGITQIGLRGCGTALPEDATAAFDHGTIITAQAMKDMHTEDMLRHIPGGNAYLTLDLDGVNPVEMPAVPSPSPGGPGMTEVIALIIALAHKCRLVGANLVECAPQRDIDGVGIRTALRLLTVLADLLSTGRATAAR